MTGGPMLNASPLYWLHDRHCFLITEREVSSRLPFNGNVILNNKIYDGKLYSIVKYVLS